MSWAPPPSPPYPPYPPYLQYQWPAAPVVPPRPNDAMGILSTRRYQTLIGAVVIALTVIAILLAALAPRLSSRTASPVPNGWAKVYDADLRPNDAHWDTAGGCSLTSQGMQTVNTSEGAYCVFTPSQSADLTKSGFYLEVTLAPAGRLDQRAVASIFADGMELVAFDQNGQYFVCNGACRDGSQAYRSGATIAWHSDGYVANTLGVRLASDDKTMSVYVNGQRVVTTSVAVGPGSELALGTVSNAEELFTHCTVYSGSGAQ